jgi:hypothetical protein
MTLPASGPITFNNVNVELGLTGTTLISLGQTNVRTLAGVASGAIAMNNLYGKSNRVELSLAYSSSTYSTVTVSVSSLSGYISGKTDLTITVNTGVWLANGLQIINNNYGDTVKIINLGFIAGTGGNGGSYYAFTYYPPSAGSNAIELNSAAVFTIDNTYGAAFIGGGGGGGGGALDDYIGGGGGAGGGSGGNSLFYDATGGSGGLIGSSGGNGAVSIQHYIGGGGGGRIFPGLGGDSNSGGGAGGGGGSYIYANDGDFYYGSGGGGANYSGQQAANNAGAGGGGWGASGGYSGVYGGTRMGASGGYAVRLNGASLSFVSNDLARVYGAVV